MKLANISFLQYYNLRDRKEYNYALKFAEIKPNDIFKIGSLTDLSFGFVKDIQTIFNQNGFIGWDDLFREIETLTGIKKFNLASRKLFDLHSFRLYLYEQIEDINKKEREYLSHKPDANEQIAGIEDFGKYGAFLQFDNLAGGDILKYDEVRQLSYDVCFTKLLLDAERSEFQNRLMNLKTKK